MSAAATIGAAVFDLAVAAGLLIASRLWLRRATDYNRWARSHLLGSSRQPSPLSERVVRVGGAGFLAATGVAVALATAIGLLVR